MFYYNMLHAIMGTAAKIILAEKVVVDGRGGYLFHSSSTYLIFTAAVVGYTSRVRSSIGIRPVTAILEVSPVI